MRVPGHRMILASAGSGKTYALTNRYLALLAGGAEPGRIAALTFTRKAAGEFFDEILRKLAKASSSDEAADKISREIGFPGFKRPDFGRMLRSVVDEMHRLLLGTLDGFFAEIVRAFPLELGLSGDFEILQEHAAGLERRRATRLMLAAAGRTDAAQRAFVEDFKSTTFGSEEKSLGARLDRYLEEHAEIFLGAPDPEAWGRAERIWPGGCAALARAPHAAAAIAALREALAGGAFSDGQRERWDGFFADGGGWRPGAELPERMEYILRNALKVWPDVGRIVVERRSLDLAPAAASALREAVMAMVGAEFARRLEMTRGLFKVLSGYDAVYDGSVRRLGRLTFSDLQRLLLPSGGPAIPPLTSRPDADARLFIDWRLDSRIDHWLLDEFQDTSFDQWKILENLIDEAVQDPSRSRSFFYVGDVKQAIFGWRDGDARLFREIFDKYNAIAKGTITAENLTQSHRSGPAVIRMVNRVFGDEAAFRRLFPEAAARWAGEWREHSTAHPELAGYAELRRAGDEEGRFSETLRILQEIRPLDRGLSAAVLVQSNATAADLANFIRTEGGIPAIAESDLSIADNPLAGALLALLKAASHPGDAAARALVRLSPLEGVLERMGMAEADRLTSAVMRSIHGRGFERTVEGLLRQLEPLLAPDDDFSRARGLQLVAAARVFDGLGGRDPAVFADFARDYTVRDADLAGAVRVMTIHKSKGLGFDLVILPDLEGKSLAVRRAGKLAVKRRPDRTVEWVLGLPGIELARHDPVLGAHVAAEEADACYEKLCLLYVAMTRAKRATYVVAGRAKGESRNFPKLLEETLGDTWSEGDPAWHGKCPIAAEGPLTEERLEVAAAGLPPKVRRDVIRPSARRAGRVGAAAAFALDPAAGAEFGSAVHALLAQVEWTDTPLPAALEHPADPAAKEAAACLASPDLAELWARPAGAARAEVWRERGFELARGDSWITGVFDRVVVSRDASGRAIAAVVFDFKTDRMPEGADTETEAGRHAAQMGLYRQAAAVLTGLAPEAVRGEVVFTRIRKRAAPPLF